MEEKSNEVGDLIILKSIVKYCLIIISIPITSFFVAKILIFDSILGLESISSNVYSALIAVIVLHVSLGVYIYKAYYEAEKAPKPVKID